MKYSFFMKYGFLLSLGLLPLTTTAVYAEDEQQLMQIVTNQASTDEAKGLAIAKIADLRDTGWKDSEARMKMILKNRQGRESRRKVRVRSMEVAGDGDKGLSIFDTPRDVKGTAVLTFSHSLIPDEQWIYLPALKRVKRISSANKSGPFMGSEFAYEDIASQEVDKYTYKYLRDENFNGMDCYVIERYPAYKHSGYKRQVGWIDKQHFNAQKIVFYDRKNALLKTLTNKGYNQYLGKYWRAKEMSMQNHQTGKSTRLLWETYDFNKNFKDRDFNKNALKRIR